jgi:hypothetical protein
VFSHSGISGSQPVSGSPELFAAVHALRRLSSPRHPPCALRNLTLSLRHASSWCTDSDRNPSQTRLKSMSPAQSSEVCPHTLRAVLGTSSCHHQTDSLESLGALWMLQNLFSCQRTVRLLRLGWRRGHRAVPKSGRKIRGAERDRTDDLRLAKPALSQLSYSPSLSKAQRWARAELNCRPHAYQACALTT